MTDEVTEIAILFVSLRRFLDDPKLREAARPDPKVRAELVRLQRTLREYADLVYEAMGGPRWN